MLTKGETMYTKPDCIFCKIIRGEIPCPKIYEDKSFISFLDISPANKGHALVLPKKHYTTALDMPENEFKEMAKIGQKITSAIMLAIKPGGINMLINNGKPAGQEVDHVHLHIMPRYSSDDFKIRWTHKEYAENELEKYAKNIKEKINK